MSKRLELLRLLNKQRKSTDKVEKKQIMNEIDDLENEIDIDIENGDDYADDDYSESGGYSRGYISDINKYLN